MFELIVHHPQLKHACLSVRELGKIIDLAISKPAGRLLSACLGRNSLKGLKFCANSAIGPCKMQWNVAPVSHTARLTQRSRWNVESRSRMPNAFFELPVKHG